VDTNALSVAGNNISNAGGMMFRNRIINGDMRIDQRNAGASVTPTTNNTYTVDRWAAILATSSKYSVQQNAGSVTPPPGFSNYLGITSLSSLSTSASDFYCLLHKIEGFNVSDLGWGTSNAKSVTLSFWVRSSLTGQFGGSVRNNTSTFYSYPFSYTIDSANTWQFVSIVIEGSANGTWGTSNDTGINIFFDIGSGSSQQATAGSWQAVNVLGATGDTSVLATNGATFYITGVQLEAGSVATPFERRPYGTELALCQRYFYKATTRSVGVTATSVNSYGQTVSWPVTMRSAPTISNASFTVASGSAGTVGTGNITVDAVGVFNSASNWSTGASAAITLDASSEL
jgi:hypothetical protein